MKSLCVRELPAHSRRHPELALRTYNSLYTFYLLYPVLSLFPDARERLGHSEKLSTEVSTPICPSTTFACSRPNDLSREQLYQHVRHSLQSESDESKFDFPRG